MTTTSIFISSVQKELAEERRALKAFIESDALLRRYFTVFLFKICRLRSFARMEGSSFRPCGE